MDCHHEFLSLRRYAARLLSIGVVLLLAEAVLDSGQARADGASYVVTKLLPLGRTFALHVMEDVAAIGVVEGVKQMVMPTPVQTPNKPEPSPVIGAPNITIFNASPSTTDGCIQGTCVGSDLSKLFNTPTRFKADDLGHIWNPTVRCDEGTDPTEALGRAVNLENGIGVLRRNPSDAVNCYEIAARKGVPLAQYRLAGIYETGDEGVLVDPARARFWLNEAAQRDFALAQTKLAVNLEREGNGPSAVYWYEEAASAGDPYALYELFRVSYYGNYGVPRDWVTAFLCLFLSVQLGQFDNADFSRIPTSKHETFLADGDTSGRSKGRAPCSVDHGYSK